MSLCCRYCQRLFSRADSRSRHEKYRCERRFEDPPKYTFPTKTSNGSPQGIEIGQAFRFKTTSSILVVGLSGCGKTWITQTSCLKIHPRPFITVMVRGKMVSWTCKGLVCNFMKGFPKQTVSSRGFLMEKF